MEVYARVRRAVQTDGMIIQQAAREFGLARSGRVISCMDLPQSDDCFVMAFPAENTESFLEGHNQAFAYFGGVPRTMRFCRKHPGSGI